MEGRAMTEGQPWKHIVRFALPVMAGSLLQQLYQTADTLIVGRFYGEDALSAVGTTVSFTFLFTALALGFSSGSGVAVAQCYGAQEEAQVRKTAGTGILLLTGMGLVATVVGFAISRPAYTYWIAVPKELLEQTLVYFRVYLLGLIFQFGYNIVAAVLRAVGDSAATLYFLLLSSVLNIGLDYLFTAGFRWGIAGVALATDISQLVSFAAAYGYMTKKYPLFRFRFRELTWDFGVAVRILAAGFPIALQMMTASLGMTFIQRAVNGFGKEMTASYTVGQRMEMYLNLPFTAFQTTLATYAGQNIGAGKPERIRQGVRQTMLIILVITAGISSLFWIFTGELISLFGLSGQAALYCRSHLRTIALANMIPAVYMPLFGVFQGADHGGVGALSEAVTLSVRVSMVYLFRNSAFLGHAVVWWNGMFGFVVGFLLCWSYYFSGRWKKKPPHSSSSFFSNSSSGTGLE